MTSPSARSLDWLRERGVLVDSTERWLTWAKKRKDLFGFADAVGVGELWQVIGGSVVGDQRIMAFQFTSGSNHDARKKKIMASPEAKRWASAFGLIFVISWRKAGPRGKRKTWTPRVEMVRP